MVRARELKFWENVHIPQTCHVSHVMCHVSHVTCHMSLVTFFFFFFFCLLTKWWSLSSEVLLSTGPTPSSLTLYRQYDCMFWNTNGHNVPWQFETMHCLLAIWLQTWKKTIFTQTWFEPKILYLKKCVNYNKSNPRQNSVIGSKISNSAKKCQKVT